MSIRYRLLIIVGLVTSLVFASAFILINQLFLQDIHKIRGEAEQFVIDNLERRRENVEVFISDNMARRLAQINAILETVSQFPALSDRFAATPENLRLGTWASAAQFLQDEDWVQFLQNTSDSKLLSLIVPDQGPFFRNERVPIEEGLAWVFVLDSSIYARPYLGVQIPFKSKEESVNEDLPIVIAENLPTVYALYSGERIQSMVLSSDLFQNKGQVIPEPSIEGYEVDEEKFYELLVKASELVKNRSIAPPKRPEPSNVVPGKEQPESLSQRYLDGILEYSYELFLIGEITALQRGDFFGSSPDAPQWPDGLSFTSKGKEFGHVFFLDPVIGFSKPVFDDVAFFEKHPPKEGSLVSSGSSILKSSRPNQAFFVNTAAIYSGTGEQRKQSLLTIGFDMTGLLQNLVAIGGQYACMVNNGVVITELVPAGYPPVRFDLIPQIIAEQQAIKGYFTMGDVEYFFAKMLPEPNSDFYFCFFVPRSEYFSLFYKLHEHVAMILQHMWSRRIGIGILSIIILWILLLDLSKKITDPIVSLSNSLRYVKSGEWDLIKIPPIKSQKNREIKQLLVSFQDMVDGMKEKEKMTGVLNKVVSKEIAQEILKGDVHLGGEEKEVTMLFGDIRGFTKMTQNMEPQDTIQLLNTCMTKLSQVVEQNKGVIDKYLGDGVMALYGAPVAYKESALCAVVSGLEMISIIQKWDEERAKAGQPVLNIGVGIHTGTVCAGNMGARNRLNYTVIGSHVNMASRLCYAAGPGELLISADTYSQPGVRENIEVEDKGFMAFKGFDDKKQVYKVLGLKNPEIGKFLVLEGME